MAGLLQQNLNLPCGASLGNRIAKAAMTEGMADVDGNPTAELERLYEIWSDGGAGMLLSGNIQIDQHHLERPGNVIIEGEADATKRDALRKWTSAATRNGNHFWAQISHAGRQTQKALNASPKGPSDIAVKLPGIEFGKPVALTHAEIQELVERFAKTAAICKETGFTGVQVHAAHGYLLSAFLNPRANNRTDMYGGALENRARFLLDVVKAVRASVGPDFPVSVKLNSADFQKGGFAFGDSLQVATWLSDAAIDLLEISGGNYELPKLLGLDGIDEDKNEVVAPSTAAREAYFIDFAKAMQHHVKVPMMVTGGFRSRRIMDYALENGAAQIIGIGRPLCYVPDAPNQLFGGLKKLPEKEKKLRLIPAMLGFLRVFQALRTLDGFGVQFWFYGQLYALGETGKPNPRVSPMSAMRDVMRREKALIAAYR